MDVQELKNVIRGRFAELSDQEKTIVSDAADSPIGDVMRKLFGPEMSSVFGEEEQEKPMTESQPMANQMRPPPMGDQMQGAGLGT